MAYLVDNGGAVYGARAAPLRASRVLAARGERRAIRRVSGARPATGRWGTTGSDRDAYVSVNVFSGDLTFRLL